MDPNEIGKFILELRKKNNLTQQKFADMFGVTYQAVSKWENGKNLPDILILKDICNKFNVDINVILGGKKRHKKKIVVTTIIISLVIIISILGYFFIIHSNHKDFEFKTLSSNCTNFNILGSVAYNKDKSSIYIADVKYCGGDDIKKYDLIECTLYESNKNTDTKISNQSTNKNDKPMTLEDFLKDLNINVDNYKTRCDSFSKADIYLQINATLNNNITSYKIPLKLKETCELD